MMKYKLMYLTIFTTHGTPVINCIHEFEEFILTKEEKRKPCIISRTLKVNPFSDTLPYLFRNEVPFSTRDASLPLM